MIWLLSARLTAMSVQRLLLRSQARVWKHKGALSVLVACQLPIRRRDNFSDVPNARVLRIPISLKRANAITMPRNYPNVHREFIRQNRCICTWHLKEIGMLEFNALSFTHDVVFQIASSKANWRSGTKDSHFPPAFDVAAKLFTIFGLCTIHCLVCAWIASVTWISSVIGYLRYSKSCCWISGNISLIICLPSRFRPSQFCVLGMSMFCCRHLLTTRIN